MRITAVRTVATVGFICAVGVTAAIVGSRSTVIDGRVIEADLYERLKPLPRHAGLASVACDPKIPVGPAGARFRCALVRDDGATVVAEFTMDRAGAIAERIVSPRR